MRILLCLVFLLGAAEARAVTLACIDVGRALEACRSAAARFTEATGEGVRVVAAPPDGRLALEGYGALFAIGSPRIDVVQFPAGWAPALAPDLVTLPVPEGTADVLGPLVAAGRVRGRQVGWPVHIALPVVTHPQTAQTGDRTFWAEARATLLRGPADDPDALAQGGVRLSAMPFLVEWAGAFGASGLQDRDALRAAFAALDTVVGRAGDPPPRAEGVPEVATPSATAVATVAPDGPAGPVIVAAWLAGVSRHSAAQEAAVRLVAFLASAEEQRRAAVEFALAPVRAGLYGEEAVRAASPVIPVLADILDRIATVPVAAYGEGYLVLVDEATEALRALLRGEADPDATANAVVRAARRAEREAD